MSNETPVTQDEPPVNHEEAYLYATMHCHDSNLARCYLDKCGMWHSRASAAKEDVGDVVTGLQLAKVDAIGFGRHNCARLIQDGIDKLRAAPGEVKCDNDECEDGQVPDETACWKPCPDCAPSPERSTREASESFQRAMHAPSPERWTAEQIAQVHADGKAWCAKGQPGPTSAFRDPSPEQQGAERGCCVADCTNVANDGWYCLTHAEARAAELMSRAKVTAEDEPDGCDCPHASAARSCGCGFCRALNCTATAPALGLSDKEQRAITTAIGSVESLGCSLDRQGVKDVAALYHEAEATLRSLLERGGV
jgi:hypothetical protein